MRIEFYADHIQAANMTLPVVPAVGQLVRLNRVGLRVVSRVIWYLDVPEPFVIVLTDAT